MEVAVAVAVLAAFVAYVVTRPLLRARRDEPGEDGGRAALEAAKEAKYREIREAELDFRMGKLSEEDYRATDRELRAQAIAILKELDSLEGEDGSDR